MSPSLLYASFKDLKVLGPLDVFNWGRGAFPVPFFYFEINLRPGELIFLDKKRLLIQSWSHMDRARNLLFAPARNFFE